MVTLHRKKLCKAQDYIKEAPTVFARMPFQLCAALFSCLNVVLHLSFRRALPQSCNKGGSVGP